MKTLLTPIERIQAYQYALSVHHEFETDLHVSLNVWLWLHDFTKVRTDVVDIHDYFPEIEKAPYGFTEIPTVLRIAIAECKVKLEEERQRKYDFLLRWILLILFSLGFCSLLFACQSSKKGGHYCPTYRSHSYNKHFNRS